MTDLIQTRKEIMNFFDSQEFVELTCNQIKKDLQGIYLDDINLELDNKTPALNQLIPIIENVLSQLIKQSHQNYLQFLYKVDLPETDKFGESIHQQALSEIAFLIIRREAQKIYLRRKFS